MGLLSRLVCLVSLVPLTLQVLTDNTFLSQFVEGGGLQASKLQLMLRDSNPVGMLTEFHHDLTYAGVLVDTLNIMNHMCRLSEERKEDIRSSNILSTWPVLLQHR
jgi:hypothetical protein